VIGDGSWFGECAASLMEVPLSSRAKEHLREQASVFDNFERERNSRLRDPGTDSSGTPVNPYAAPFHKPCGTLHGPDARCPAAGDKPWFVQWVETPDGLRHVPCGTLHGPADPCPNANMLAGNDLPPGNVADRVWAKVACGVCEGWIVRTPTGWKHQRSDGTEWTPMDGHRAATIKDDERVAASDRGVCRWTGCGRVIIRTMQGWEHRGSEPFDDHNPTP
jgi:hypothetical protein